MMPKIADPFFSVNDAKHNKAKQYVEFATPWFISVQALGGTVLLKTVTPFQAVFALNLHTRDKHHLAQRHYANHQERTIQAVIYCQDFVKDFREAGGHVFIKSILGPSDDQSAFPFVAHISPIMQLFDISFVVRGAKYDFIEADQQRARTMAFIWDFDIVPLRAQSTGAFYSGEFERFEAQSIDPIVLMDQHGDAPSAKAEPSKKIEKRKEPEPKVHECAVCMEDLDSAEQAVVVPCGHSSYCWECANKLSDCALCRTRIEGRFKIFT